MRRMNLNKAIAFLLAVLLLIGTSYDGRLRLGGEVWAGSLSPENAITFIVDVEIGEVFLIGSEHYAIGYESGGNTGIYRINIGAKALTRVCNVSSYISGSSSFVGYAKVGSAHRFIFSTSSGSTGDRNAKVSIISSTDMQSFSLSKANAISIGYPYGCSLSFSQSDGYFYIRAKLRTSSSTYEGYEEQRYQLYKSTDCINWANTGVDIYASAQNRISLYESTEIGSANQKLVLTRGYLYESDSDTGYKNYLHEYNLYTINGGSVSNIDSAQKWIEREDSREPYKLHEDEEISLSSYGKFAFVLHDYLDLKSPKTSSTTYVNHRYITLYYGLNEYNCGYSEVVSEGTALAHFDNGIYTKKIDTHGKYLYYIYTPNPKPPAGTYKVNVITGGTTMRDTNILSMTDYANSTYFSTSTGIYMKITHTNGAFTYHRLQNGSAATITEEQYNSAKAMLPIEPPIDEYSNQGYYLCYVDSIKAIFFNSNVKAFKIIYENSAPAVTITAPSQNSIFGTKDIAIIPQISVSDTDNNALTCKYYLDEVMKETKTVAGNTQTAQTVSFTALNMGTLSEGTHKMRFEISDGSLTAQAAIDFRVDKTPPVISTLGATTTDNSITITGGASDAVAGLDPLPYHYTVTDGTSTYQSGWKAGTTHTQASLQPNRNYTVKLEARDKVGNISQKTITVYIKAQRPTVTASNSAATAIDIIVSDNNPSNTQYQIMAGTKYISSAGILADAPQWITLSNKRIRATGLTPNTTYGITAKARNGANEETSASSAINGTTLPRAPENVTTYPDKYSITLAWSAMPNILSYEVSKDGSIVSGLTTTTYIHQGLMPNTQHTYKVRAVNKGGAGDWSSTITAYTLPDPPGVPVNLRAEAAQNEIRLNWDPVEGATSYDLEADNKIIESITATSYTHGGLLPNTQHTYRVRAKNRGGAGAWSDLLTKDTLPEPPGMPVGLQIKETTKGTITLIWNSTDRAESYDIEADGAIIGSTTETTYIHQGLAADTQHTYKIKARNRGGESGWTAEVIAKTLPEKPSMPNNLTATAGTREIIIIWDNAERAAEYDVEADGALIATITGTSYTHEGLASDTKHTYRVKARNAGGESGYSAMVTVYTLTESEGMTLANVAAVVTNTSITLMWDAVAADTEYDVEVDGEIKNNGKNTMYIHSGLKPVSHHTYKVRPRIGEEAGPWCAVLAVSTLPNPPDAPNNISAIVTNTTIQLMWDAEEGATGYDIEIDGNMIESTTDTIFIHKDLIPGTQHSYRIRARNIAGATPWSEAIVKSTIKPTYMIEAEAGQEYRIALTAMGMQEFKGMKIVLKYNPEEVEIIDLCEETKEIELESGNIPGTDIAIIHADGRIELEVDKMIAAGKAWTGVMNTILIKSRISGHVNIDYLVE